MKLRLHHILTLALVFIMIVVLALIEVEATDLFRPDNWAAMSIGFGASILTLVGIITSILTSNENNRRTEFIENLNIVLKKIEDKIRINPDRSLTEIYENSKKTIKALIDNMLPMKYSEGITGILSFYFFLVSAFIAVIGWKFKFVFGFFLFGIALSVGYVAYCVIEFAKIDSSSSLPKKKGELELQAVKVNGRTLPFETIGKEIFISSSQRIERIEFKVRFKGTVRNGFFHAIVRYTNGLASHIPDSNTYLANFGFVDDHILTLLEKEADTGVLQKSEQLDLSFDLILRSSKGTEENPLILKAFIERLGEKDIYKYLSIPDDFVVNVIEIRIYEDPFFKPTYKRREIDCITIHPTI